MAICDTASCTQKAVEGQRDIVTGCPGGRGRQGLQELGPKGPNGPKGLKEPKVWSPRVLACCGLVAIAGPLSARPRLAGLQGLHLFFSMSIHPTPDPDTALDTDKARHKARQSNHVSTFASSEACVSIYPSDTSKGHPRTSPRICSLSPPTKLRSFALKGPGGQAREDAAHGWRCLGHLGLQRRLRLGLGAVPRELHRAGDGVPGGGVWPGC